MLTGTPKQPNNQSLLIIQRNNFKPATVTNSPVATGPDLGQMGLTRPNNASQLKEQAKQVAQALVTSPQQPTHARYNSAAPK